MVVSAELRWFWKQSVPAELERWFASPGLPPAGFEAREDVYLLDPAQAELGLKQRGKTGGVEIKGLVRRPAQPLAAGPFTGHVELWSKWTSEALRLDGLPSVVVRKVRRLRRFDTGSAGVEEVTDAIPENGCNLELTEVSIAGRAGSWWTLGFEAFGALDRVESHLGRTLEHLLRREVPTFDPGVERSYPGWLAERGTG